MLEFTRWTEAYLKFLTADKERSLEPKELETYALSAYLTGRDVESYQILERAHQNYLGQGNTQMAIRCSFWLGLMLLNKGEKARGGGWFARGQRLFSDENVPECAEKGFIILPDALSALFAGRDEKAEKLFNEVTTIGEYYSDTDLTVIGRLGLGQAIILQGKVAKGMKLLDETMITTETEDVFPVLKGIVYCAVIESCLQVWDLRRAQEWTLALMRWCEAQPDIVSFRGQCLVRKAEIIQLHGEWHKALKETKDACELMTRPPGEPAAGEAFYRKAELHRLLGDSKKAENCYHEAAKWGRKPQPGLALLRLAQGQNDMAETSIRNTLKETNDKTRRVELLPAIVTIMLAVKQTEEARYAANELSDIAIEFDTPYLYAISSYCQGAVFLSEGRAQQALENLQKALKLWNTLQLPYESAKTSELKAFVYLQMNDKDNSDIELAAAKWVFEQLKAMPDLERINRWVNKRQHRETHGLTLRELQVLWRLAAGKTNKFIANELFISVRTVDRHVSNIFNKLDVSSRAEATAFAFNNNILDKQF